ISFSCSLPPDPIILPAGGGVNGMRNGKLTIDVTVQSHQWQGLRRNKEQNSRADENAAAAISNP
ncbi:MAG: hypothetical protein ACSW8J_10050, partial [bacterium]